MDLAENRFGKTWKHFLEVLKVDYNCVSTQFRASPFERALFSALNRVLLIN